MSRFEIHYGSGAKLLFIEFYKNFPNYNVLMNNFDNYTVVSNSIICDDLKQKNLHTLSIILNKFPN